MTRSPDRDPMHDVVAGERENLLNSGVVSGGDAFREGVVGSGVGVPAKDATEQIITMATSYSSLQRNCTTDTE